MPTRTRNPFTVFGITPQVVARLDDDTLFKLVKASYRILQLTFHPDKSRKKTEAARRKSNEQASEINLAYERLNYAKDPDSFKKYKEEYLKSSGRESRKVNKLQQALQIIMDRNRDMAESFWDFFVQAKGLEEKSAPELICTGILDNVCFSLIDVAIKENVRTESWVSGIGYKEIRFNEKGNMQYRFPFRKTFSDINFITLIGTIPKDKIDIDALLEKKPLKSALSIPNHSSVQKKIPVAHLETMNTVTISDFKWHCLPYLRPQIVEGSYLFALHRNEPDKVFLEGVILKIRKAHPKAVQPSA